MTQNSTRANYDTFLSSHTYPILLVREYMNIFVQNWCMISFQQFHLHYIRTNYKVIEKSDIRPYQDQMKHFDKIWPYLGQIRHIDKTWYAQVIRTALELFICFFFFLVKDQGHPSKFANSSNSPIKFACLSCTDLVSHTCKIMAHCNNDLQFVILILITII